MFDDIDVSKVSILDFHQYSTVFMSSASSQFCYIWRLIETIFGLTFHPFSSQSFPILQGPSSNKFVNDGSFLQQFIRMHKDKPNSGEYFDLHSSDQNVSVMFLSNPYQK